jgi:hypothetical protein
MKYYNDANDVIDDHNHAAAPTDVSLTTLMSSCYSLRMHALRMYDHAAAALNSLQLLISDEAL